MDTKKCRLFAVISIIAAALLARAVGVAHSYAAVGSSPNLVLFLDYLYTACDAILLGVSIAAIARARFAGTNRSSGAVFALASLVYVLDSVASIVFDVIFNTLSYDEVLAVFTLGLQAFYRIIIYAVAWVVASVLFRRGAHLSDASSGAARFFSTPLGAALLSVIISFSVGFLGEAIYNFNFALRYNFQLTPSEISSVIGSTLLVILAEGLIPTLTVYSYIGVSDRVCAKREK